MSGLVRRILDRAARGPQPPALVPMPADHVLQAVWEDDLPRLELVCRAAEAASCRMRPADDRDQWSVTDSDLTPGHRCWVEEWIEAAGLDDVELVGAPRVLAEIPIPRIYFDEGPVLDFQAGGEDL